jgi:hypothetical protein
MYLQALDCTQLETFPYIPTVPVCTTTLNQGLYHVNLSKQVLKTLVVSMEHLRVLKSYEWILMSLVLPVDMLTVIFIYC